MLLQRSTPLAKTSGLDLSFLTTFAGERAGLGSSAPATRTQMARPAAACSW